MIESAEIARSVKQKALELGFSACGFAPVERLEQLEPGYLEWLDAGNAGEMNYLSRNVEVRLDPGKLVDGAKTVISLAANYYFPLTQTDAGSPRISRYAHGADYHIVLKSRGRQLLDWIQSEWGPVKGRVFTDSAPIFEREWARRAGLGWIGKNGCLILPKQGSWFFLAEIVIDREILSEATIIADHCGSCTRCVEACPTQALCGDGSMNPRKCISYLTIEHKGEIPVEFKGKLQNRVFGCDVCQDICPWNKKPNESSISEFEPKKEWLDFDYPFYSALDAEAFEKIFKGTPVERTGWSGILRNFDFLGKE